jgi:hypothetical protein
MRAEESPFLATGDRSPEGNSSCGHYYVDFNIFGFQGTRSLSVPDL